MRALFPHVFINLVCCQTFFNSPALHHPTCVSTDISIGPGRAAPGKPCPQKAQRLSWHLAGAASVPVTFACRDSWPRSCARREQLLAVALTSASFYCKELAPQPAERGYSALFFCIFTCWPFRLPFLESCLGFQRWDASQVACGSATPAASASSLPSPKEALICTTSPACCL